METKNKSKTTSKSSKKSQAKTPTKSKSQTKSRKKSKAKKIIKKILFFISLIIFCYFAYQYYVKPYFASLDSNYEQVIDSESSSVEQSNINKTQKQTEVDKDENYVFASEYSQNNPLFFGNPSDAVFDVSSETNYLMEKSQFTISYNNKKLIPNWVGWHLGQQDLGEAERSDKFILTELSQSVLFRLLSFIQSSFHVPLTKLQTSMHRFRIQLQVQKEFLTLWTESLKKKK